MSSHSSECDRKDYIVMPQSEIQAIAEYAAAQGPIETGGICFGLWTRGGRPMILFVTGPGPNASHEYAHYQEDFEFFHRAVRTIEGTYGVQLLGNWHSHHVLGLAGPSGPDIAQVQSVCQANSFSSWMGIIVTFSEVQGGSQRQDAASGRLKGQAPRAPQIALNAFIYRDPVQGKPRRCPIRVLPAVSPLRLAILASGRRELGGVGEFYSGFPMDQIAYEAYETPDDRRADRIGQFPATLLAQLQDLAANGLEKAVDLRFVGDLVAATLPTPGGNVAEAILDGRSPHLVQGMQVRRGVDDTAVDLSEVFRGHTLAELFEKSESLRLDAIVNAVAREGRVELPAGGSASGTGDTHAGKSSDLTKLSNSRSEKSRCKG